MGQAKRRGTFEQRKEEAIAIGKMPFHSEKIPTGRMDPLTQLELGLYNKRKDGWRKIKI